MEAKIRSEEFEVLYFVGTRGKEGKIIPFFLKVVDASCEST